MNTLPDDKELRKRSPVKPGGLAVAVGAGASGEAAARLLALLGARVRLLDKKSENVTPQFAKEAAGAGVEVITGPHEAKHFQGASLVVTSPGVPLTVLEPLLLEAGNPPLMGELELAWHFTREPVLAITGTSGKTTTASLAAAMLAEAGKKVFLGGNIGTPLSAHVLSGRAADVLVLEVSSFQLQTAPTFRPHVAVLLNLSPNHLDWHKDMEEYAGAKFRIFANQTAEDVAILPPELADSYSAGGFRGEVRAFSPCGRFSRMRLVGPHNEANAEAAFMAAHVFGVSEAQAASAVEKFEPIEHRLERVGEKNGVIYVNDSKSTTVDSLRVALNAFTGPVVLLAGGKFKGGDLAGLVPLLRQKVRAVRLFGASREIFEKAWKDSGISLDWHADMAGAVASAAQAAQKGDVVLLSPATASFDLYANYKERGKDFARLVKEQA